jgi:Na+/proline symporter
MYVVTALTMFTLVLLVSLPCVAAALLWPNLREPGADRELAYGLLMKKLLPSGALGLVTAAMLAGVMSTVGDNLNFGSQVMLNDIYRRWMVRNASERHYLIIGKLCMLIILALALTVVYKTRIIFDVAVFMLQLSSAELPANWAQWWWWRFNGKARVAASFGGGVIFCLVVFGPPFLGWLGFGWANRLITPWWNQTFVIMGLTTILWISVALLTRPDPDAVLERFYLQARPLGSWRPVRARLNGGTCDFNDSETSTGSRPIWRGLLIALVGAAGSISYILGLSNLYVGYTGFAVTYLVGAAALALLFVRFLSPYLDSLELD